MQNRLLFMLLINLKLKRETYKFSPNNSTHTLNSRVRLFLNTRFYIAGILAENSPDVARIVGEEMDINPADSIPTFRK